MSIAKKLFIISSSLLALLLIFWGIYNLAFKKNSSPATAVKTPAPSTEPAKPEERSADNPISSSKIIPISDEAVLAPTVVDSKQIKYYAASNGRVYTIDLDGKNKKVVTDQDIFNLQAVYWSPNKDQIVDISSQNGGNRYYYYSFKDNRGLALGENINNVVWQNNDRILYRYFNPQTGKNSVSIADPDGSNWKNIADLDFTDVRLAPVSRTSLVSFWNAPDAYTETKLMTVPAIGGEVKNIFQGKFGADYLWSPDGSKILISHSNEKKGTQMQLALTNDKGGEYKNLNLPTLVSKCLWSSDSKLVYCAMPTGLPPNAILPNDYSTKQLGSTDTFWKINVATGEKTRLVELDKIGGQYDASDLFLSINENYLFFINHPDGKLYRLDL